MRSGDFGGKGKGWGSAPKCCKVKKSGEKKEGLPGGKWEMDVKMRLSGVPIRRRKKLLPMDE